MKNKIQSFRKLLMEEEKSNATVEKYIRDVEGFCTAANGKITKETVINYKNTLCTKYKPAGVNSRLVAINRFLKFIGKDYCCVKLLKIQRQIFTDSERELTAGEYRRLVGTAGESRIGCVIQAICLTGIRVSELQFITVEAVRRGTAEINCKGKQRVIMIPLQAQQMLKKYIKKAGVTSGAVFVTRGGKPLNRCNIWREMKALCARAGVSPFKVFPHNLRHLFARTFYHHKKDIIRLADVLGHSSVETTRIYTIETGNRHRQELEEVSKLLFAT